ncbi:MAG: hypothetical protein SFT68_02305 [Rickettsiaceae bacterium]|nr:hypothetical protein [Rickettsiaceae bacterium]
MILLVIPLKKGIQKMILLVIPLKKGIQKIVILDSRLRGNDT